ncbi:hypothetical protein V5O48_013016, partial [Marasmius crinis-equi]
KLEDQFQELVLKPSLKWRWWRNVRELAGRLSLGSKCPNLVVIDGLDECSDDKTQLRILSTISTAYKQTPHSPLRFLICSRPESWLREAFDAPALRQITECIVLDDKFLPSRDIERYYLHHFNEIRRGSEYVHVQFPDPWPSEEDLECLRRKTSDQFVYAFTVVEFTKLKYFHPVKQLRIILDSTTSPRPQKSPFYELDCLYHVVLSANTDRDMLLAILSAVLLLPSYITPSPYFIEFLLRLSSGEVALSLRAMHSVLAIGDLRDEIRVYHTSFREFLPDQSRSGVFYIDVLARMNILARQWVRAFVETCKAKDTHRQALDRRGLGRPDRLGRGLFLDWDQLLISLQVPSQELLDDLQGMDVAAFFYLKAFGYTYYPKPGLPENTGTDLWLEPRRCWPVWDHVFEEITTWMNSVAPSTQTSLTINSDLVKRLLNPPSCLHVLMEPTTSLNGHIICLITLNITGCKWACRLVDAYQLESFNEVFNILLLNDCHCLSAHRTTVTSDTFDTANDGLPSDFLPLPHLQPTRTPPLADGRRPVHNRISPCCNVPVTVLGDDTYHFNLQDACFQTAQAFVEDFSQAVSNGNTRELYAIFVNLLQSSLLRNCVQGPPLFALCRTFFSRAAEADWPRFAFVDRNLLMELREKSLEWLGV